jgi:outer membrane PBP1 activator LpoA protein
MLIKGFRSLLAALALGYLAGCAAPCGAPGRLCAPTEPNTSAATQAHPAAGPPQPAPAAIPPVATAAPPPAARPLRIALLLPLQSATLGLPAEAVRDGFMAAYQRDHAGVEVELVATGDKVEDVVSAHAAASGRSDIVVGPLSRQAVGAVAASQASARPTIALNHPDPGVILPQSMLAIGLSIEDEARQAADWAAREHPQGRALILAGNGTWQQRVAQAFEARWAELGRNSHMADLPAANDMVDADAIDVVRTRMEVDPPELIFAALDAGQLRQVRSVLGTAIACYAASPANPGPAPGQPVAELDGLRLLDLPWEVEAGSAGVLRYPRRAAGEHTLEMDRLYALGIDAYLVARALGAHPGAGVELDGVTGKLAFRPGADPAFRRIEPAVVYRGGAFDAQPAPH